MKRKPISVALIVIILIVQAVFIASVVFVAMRWINSVNKNFLWFEEGKTELISPDEQYKLRIEGWTTIGGGKTEIYQVWGIRKRLLGEIYCSMHDATLTEKGKEYEVVWGNDSVTFTVANKSGVARDYTFALAETPAPLPAQYYLLPVLVSIAGTALTAWLLIRALLLSRTEGGLQATTEQRTTR